jgi:trans-aconitate 2-methyltransferase
MQQRLTLLHFHFWRSIGAMNGRGGVAGFGNEWDSESYHRIAEPQFTWGMKLVESLQLRGDETVLDAGCASGKLTAELLKRLPKGRVIAVDLSENMVTAAREFLRPQFGERVVCMHSDLSELMLEKTVDGVFSAATFHWVSDRRRMFERLCAALKPGGWFVAQAGGGRNLHHFWRVADRVVAREPFAEHLKGFKRQQDYLDPEITREQMAAAGFREIEVDMQDAPVRFPNAGAFREFIKTVNFKNHVEKLPAELRERLLNEVADESMRSEMPLTLDYERINLRARR